MDLAPAFETMVRTAAAVGILAVTAPSIIQAQIGLSSGSAQIAMIASVPSRASIAGVSTSRETARLGTMREGTVKVRVSANAGSRLVVVGTGQAGGAPVWVRDVEGEFREVTSSSAVIVARDRRAAGEWVGEVRYRAEALNPVEADMLPLRYEIRVEPTI